jgi:Tfp pilus assembly protein PilX
MWSALHRWNGDGAMKHELSNDRGFAMVIALTFLTGLAVVAVIIVAVATMEKRTAFNEYTYTRSFYSADAGSEAAVNWLRFLSSPPGFLDPSKTVYVPAGYTTITPEAKYKYNVTYLRKRHRAGWSKEYLDYEYRVDSDGTSVQDSESQVEVQALRLFKEGY